MTEPDARSAIREGLPGLADADGELGEMVRMATALAELVAPYASPDFECLMAPLPPTPPVSYPRVDGIPRAWRDFSEPFASVEARLERVVEGENAFVMFVRQTVVTKHGGVEMTQPGALVVIIEEGRIPNVQFHLDQDAALRAGGLQPTDPEA